MFARTKQELFSHSFSSHSHDDSMAVSAEQRNVIPIEQFRRHNQRQCIKEQEKICINNLADSYCRSFRSLIRKVDDIDIHWVSWFASRCSCIGIIKIVMAIINSTVGLMVRIHPMAIINNLNFDCLECVAPIKFV